jgi:sortase A
VLGDFGDNRVTLTACHPKLSSRERIIVAAELVEAPVEAPEFNAETIAAFVDQEGFELPSEELDGESEQGSPVPDQRTTANLDEGLNGERGAIPGAVVWLILATALWVLGGYVGRRFFTERMHRLAVRVASLAPVGFCLWFAFEMIDRALPAG